MARPKFAKPGRSRRRVPRLTPERKAEIREQRWRMDGGRCVDCGRRVILLRGYWCSMHLHHIKTRGAGGSWELSNLATLCLNCHQLRHNPKSCPPKEAA